MSMVQEDARNTGLQPTEPSVSFTNSSVEPEDVNDGKGVEKEELEALNFDMSLFWRIEGFAGLNKADAVEPKDQFDSFAEKITRAPDGRYFTPIPWTKDKWRQPVERRVP